MGTVERRNLNSLQSGIIRTFQRPTIMTSDPNVTSNFPEAREGQASVVESIDLRGSPLEMLHLLLAGYFSPATGYHGAGDTARALEHIPSIDRPSPIMPLLLGMMPERCTKITPGCLVALRDPEGVQLATLHLSEKWTIDDLPVALRNDVAIAGYAPDTVFLAGEVHCVEMPVHFDFVEHRMTSDELHQQYSKRGWTRVLACQPSHMLHRADTARIVHAARLAQANILVQVLATGDQTMTLDHYTRIRCIEHGMRYLPERGAMLAVLPAPTTRNGAQSVLLRAVLARNSGATHLLVEPEWWGTASDVERAKVHAAASQLHLELVDLPRFDRDATLGAFLPVAREADAPAPAAVTDEIVKRVRAGTEVPGWMTFPEVVEELRRSHPVRGRQGVTVFFTGLSGAGKSTIARVLLAKLLELGERTVTLLDGDVVRKHLSSELGFSRAHRDLNIQRIGFVASEITKHGGIAICAPIAPYRSTRQTVRNMVQAHGGFFEIHVATPLETCEARDRKGLYAKARAGIIKEFTGISDPYEVPDAPELSIDTRGLTPLEAAQMIVTRLENEGFIG